MEDALFWQEEAAHGQDSDSGERERPDRSQDEACPGGRHDYPLFKWCHPNLPTRVRLEMDRGYDGIQKDCPHLNVEVPFMRRIPGQGRIGVKAKELTGKCSTGKSQRRGWWSTSLAD